MTERTKSQIGRSSRRKGQVSERALAAELSALLGIEVKRRVRNHANDSDLVGLTGWSAESKCCKVPAMSAWWQQTVAQAKPDELPVLFVKLPRRPFRAFLPLGLFIGGAVCDDVRFTVEMSLESFAAVYRELEAEMLSQEMRDKKALLKIGMRVQ